MLRKSLITLVVVGNPGRRRLFRAGFQARHRSVAWPGQAQTFDTALIAHGAELAALGDCSSCHTTAGGKGICGRLAVPTPFGTIYSSNITPDTETGIGRWTEAAFERAMREGVDRNGHFLYPAFPFDHFTHVTDDDIKALYAYFMTRDPVNATPPRNALQFPYSVRQVMPAGKCCTLKKGPLPAVSGRAMHGNRGRYLAEGLGHCARVPYAARPVWRGSRRPAFRRRPR